MFLKRVRHVAFGIVLDQLTGKSYTDGVTPAASYQYNKGWLSSSSNATASDSYTYDGRAAEAHLPSRLMVERRITSPTPIIWLMA